MAARVGRLLLDAEELDFIPCSDLFRESFELFAHQGDTCVSLADAAIAHDGRERTDGLILTFDKEFRKLRGIRSLGETTQ
ncbi:MAG TPA: hypothetical protein VGS58_07110 [Candidatus Sulfopaludibacter sp.]|nr:hypothetical protein [Candidatus Sulfopaludibacter sp.]